MRCGFLWLLTLQVARANRQRDAALAPAVLLLPANSRSYSISTRRPLRVRTSPHEVLYNALRGLRILQFQGLLQSASIRRGNLPALFVRLGYAPGKGVSVYL
ncbi:unnamed protein product, partial [Bubo scandiacus]